MKNLFTWVLLFTAISLHAQQDAGWLRHQTISPDGSQIVFS